ncbi:hypothetical protein AVEN_182665-1 [Araneus ventricosus]|uniref:Uncharacterized protein n=1 Tax=Araneus ventricosus TaxID=182803 RepID=A0A4Y2T0H9_ARAVE|nr:hypothetical protein AVEN_182665-1 [Araneus ventricosus]
MFKHKYYAYFKSTCQFCNPLHFLKEKKVGDIITQRSSAVNWGSRGGLVVRYRLRGRSVPGPIPVILHVFGPLHAKSYVGSKTFYRWCGADDRSSKLRGPSSNSSHVASKRDVNITELTKPVMR